MAKLSSVEKNNRRKRMAKKFLPKRTKLKSIIMDKSKSIEERFEATLKLSSLPRNGALNRVKNRCEVSGRARGYYRKLKMSRIALRDLSNNGQIPGMIKSSW